LEGSITRLKTARDYETVQATHFEFRMDASQEQTEDGRMATA
jgi:hypothetical protein